MMQSADTEAVAARLMSEFAQRTGLTAAGPPHRYLWTDAFAIVNFLNLFRKTGNKHFRNLAGMLIEQVHRTLGRHRIDDTRRGWLSGLSEQDGAEHPTAGGLRIGKPLPERRPDEPPNPSLEWDRDGQYFHYLTKWMDALCRAAVMLNEPRFHRHAVELAKSIFPHFLQTTHSGDPIGLAWKMSIDLARAQVAGINPHDALDGYVTFRQINNAAQSEIFQPEIGILRELCSNQPWGTDDPLGLGGLLMDASRLAALPDRTTEDDQIISDVLVGAAAGLRQYMSSKPFAAPLSRRLAFRELGLAIGLQALPTVITTISAEAGLFGATGPALVSLQMHVRSEQDIVEFWSDAQHRSGSLWPAHRDINDVMLATTLLRAYVTTGNREASATFDTQPQR